MAERQEIMLTGSGGQGMILAGIVLARAGLKDGKEAVQTQSYGPESRGGASRAEVIFSSDPIDYPKVEAADVLLAMTQEAYAKYALRVKPGAIIIIDPLLVEAVPQSNVRVVRADITRLAREAAGRDLVANMVALGVINQVAKLVSPAALEAAVAESVPRGTEETNLKALHAGMSVPL